MDYKTAWDYQESLLQENTRVKSSSQESGVDSHGARIQMLNDVWTPNRTPNSQLNIIFFSSSILPFIPLEKAVILKMF